MKNNMSKKLNIILVGMFCSASVMAQTDTLTAHRDNMAVDFGRNIVHDMKEVTGAVSVVGSGTLSHKRSINPGNQLFGTLSGLQVLQNSLPMREPLNTSDRKSVV